MYSITSKKLNSTPTNYETLYRTAHTQNLELRERIMKLESINFQLRQELQTAENNDLQTEVEVLRKRNADMRHQIFMLGGTQL